MLRLRRRPSPALVVACLALAVALGGTGYAAVALPANSVGTKQLKQGAIIAAKVKPHSLLAENFKDGQLPAGPQGPAGTAGATGLTGAAGANAAKLFATVLPNKDQINATLGPSIGLAPNGVQVQSGSSYLLTFAQDVSNCAVIASGSGKDTGDADLFRSGQATAQTIGGGAVAVQTFDTEGFFATLRSFTVVLFC
jgi:hypothetical protein